MRMALILVFAVMFSACGGSNAPDPLPQLPVVSSAAPANAVAKPPEPEPKDLPTLPVAPAVPQGEADYISFEGGLRVYPAAGRVEMQAVLLGSQTRALEFLVVAPGGATHEALFTAGAKGEYLKRGLEMIGLREAETKRGGRGYSELPLGDKVDIRVRFMHAGTKKVAEVPVEDWLLDISSGKQPERGGWAYTGSFEQYDASLNRSRVEADMKSNIVALWRDASCVIDNARRSGATPDVYSPNPDAPGIPRAQSEVTLVFTAYKE